MCGVADFAGSPIKQDSETDLGLGSVFPQSKLVPIWALGSEEA
jgi:hypothetical protein